MCNAHIHDANAGSESIYQLEKSKHRDDPLKQAFRVLHSRARLALMCRTPTHVNIKYRIDVFQEDVSLHRNKKNRVQLRLHTLFSTDLFCVFDIFTFMNYTKQ